MTRQTEGDAQQPTVQENKWDKKTLAMESLKPKAPELFGEHGN